MPAPEEYVKLLAPDLAGDMPDRWVHRLMKRVRFSDKARSVGGTRLRIRPQVQVRVRQQRGTQVD
jgi:hypothetical protein